MTDLGLGVTTDALAALLKHGPRDQVEADRDVEAFSILCDIVRSYCRREFVRGTRTVVLEGTWSSVVRLPETPVHDVTSVTAGGQLLPASAYTFTRAGRLVRPEGWGGPCTDVEVEYDAGFDEIPSDLAAVVITAGARLSLNPVGMQSLRIQWGDTVTQTWLPFTFSLVERAVLDKYRARTWPR
jgi:hypothetical protein